MAQYLNLADIQGYIVRGYHMKCVRHFVLQVNNAQKGKGFLGHLVDGDPQIDPQITPASDWKKEGWEDKPPYCLNIGLTFRGLKALNLPEASLASFSASKAFVNGSVARASLVGDTGMNGPNHWEEALRSTDAHMLLSLYASAKTPPEWRDVREKNTEQLKELFQNFDIEIQGTYDGEALPDDQVHFGFRDGISQPLIEGTWEPAENHIYKYTAKSSQGQQDEEQEEKQTVPAGAFLLGHVSQWTDFCYPVPQPEVLGVNGSFAAFRMLEQNVAQFNKDIEAAASEFKMQKEKIKAKICGRWENGLPITTVRTFGEYQEYKQLDEKVSQKDDEKLNKLKEKFYRSLNRFDYENDPDGHGCPFGAHIRRTNPRMDRIAGNADEKDPESSANKRRIIRRGMPYGPAYTEGDKDTARGLLGLFICASLEDQFEFLMNQWVNQGGFTGPLPTSSKDPLIGNNEGMGKFTIPSPFGDKQLLQLSQYVTTKGGLYCFLPSISALKYIAQLPEERTASSQDL